MRSPRSFRLWSAIGTIAAVLERRCWTVTDVKPLFPNLYTVLAGSPASGKTIMVNKSKEMLRPLIRPDGVKLGPDNPTAASFMDALAGAAKIVNGLSHAAMYVPCTELGDLISKFDKDFVAKLTTIFDNPDDYSMPRRSVTSLMIEAPTVNILAAATPDALGDIIPESAWGQGFTSRVIFVYGGIPTMKRNIFKKSSEADLSGLKTLLVEFFEELYGEFIWEPDAQAAMGHWFNEEKLEPVPTYGRLVNYCGRRDTHAMKLAMVSAVSAGHGLTVTLSDFRRAQSWLFEAETTMPDVFRAMAQKSDTQLLQDAHYWLHNRYFRVPKDQRIAIKEREIGRWFESKVPHEKIAGLILALVQNGRARKLEFGGYIPNPIDDELPTEVADVTGNKEAAE